MYYLTSEDTSLTSSAFSCIEILDSKSHKFVHLTGEFAPHPMLFIHQQ